MAKLHELLRNKYMAWRTDLPASWQAPLQGVEPDFAGVPTSTTISASVPVFPRLKADPISGAPARASGRPGVALVITGPGVTNVATPVGEAYTDSSPVLVLSSNNRRDHVDACAPRRRGCGDHGMKAAREIARPERDDPSIRRGNSALPS